MAQSVVKTTKLAAPASAPTAQAPAAAAAPKKGRPRGSVGPKLTFNRERDKAIVMAARAGVSSFSELTAQLRNSPAFADAPDGALQVGKVRLRYKKLFDAYAEKGVALPEMGHGSYRIDVDALEAEAE
jgi:hypothetical protein